MDFADLLSLLLLPIAFLILGVSHRKIAHTERYRNALVIWVIAMIVYYPVSNFFAIGAYIGIVARPVGFVLVLMSIYKLCMALIPDTTSSMNSSNDRQDSSSA
jgi:hypothetical protein